MKLRWNSKTAKLSKLRPFLGADFIRKNLKSTHGQSINESINLFANCATDTVHGERIDLGVEPNKSTTVDLGIRSRVGSILLGAVDQPSNLKREVTLVLLYCKWT